MSHYTAHVILLRSLISLLLFPYAVSFGLVLLSSSLHALLVLIDVSLTALISFVSLTSLIPISTRITRSSLRTYATTFARICLEYLRDFIFIRTRITRISHVALTTRTTVLHCSASLLALPCIPMYPLIAFSVHEAFISHIVVITRIAIIARVFVLLVRLYS